LTASRGAGRIAWLLLSPTEQLPARRAGAGDSRGPVACRVLCAYFEGQAERTAVGVALVMICLGLTGCSLFGKKQAARKDNPKPFLGNDTPAKAETAALPRDTNGHLPGANGVLAGQVVVEATEKPIRASILIKNLDREEAKAADIDLSTDDTGYFAIPKLDAGKSYLIIARANDNGELISRTMYVKPPNPSMLIRLDKRWTTASTPPPPPMPGLQDKKATAGAENNPDHKPTVNIDPPITLPDQGPQRPGGIAAPSPGPGSGANPVGGTAPNPANIADNSGGFHRIPQTPAETITIPNPPPRPQQPQWDTMPDSRQPGRGASSIPQGSVRMPYIETPVPSCGLYGNRLDNLALRDLDGNVWEYKKDKDRRGRLLLLDFWRHNCGPCLQGIPHLVELQRDFGPYGLEIVGIACETGEIEQQRSYVRSIRGRYNINYRTLLNGGPPYPVTEQFQVTTLPLLVLIDADGTIIWRSPSDGMDERAHYALRKLIDDRLVAHQSQP
jgi:thiol-disulfide isomerase/thioredoxin